MEWILDIVRIALPIHIGPEMWPSVLRSLALCGYFFAIGWVFSRRLLGARQLVELVPLSGVIGLSAFIFLANALAYVTGVANAFRLTAILLILAAGLLWLRPLRLPKPLVAEGLLGTAIYVVVAVAFTIIVISNYIVLPTLDYQIHFDAANRLALGQFPLMNVASPDFSARYHYGTNLLAAAFIRLGHLPVEGAYLFVGVGMPVLLFLLVYAIAREVSGSRYLAFVPALLAAFTDGLQFLTPWVQDWRLGRWARELGGFTLTERSRLDEFLGVLLPNEFTTYPRFLTNPHVLLGLALLFGVFYILLVRKDQSWAGLFIAGILLATLALVEEVLLVFAVAGLTVAFLTAWKKTLHRRRLFLVGCVSAIAIIFQGGVISDMLFRRAGGEGFSHAFSFNWPILIWFNNLIPVQLGISPFWLEHYILVLGMPFLLLPLLALWTVWRGAPFDRAILVVVLLAFLIPHLIAYAYSPDMFRLIRYGHVVASVGLGFMLISLARRHILLVPAIVISLLVVLTPLRIAAGHVSDDRQATLGWDRPARLSLTSVFRTARSLDNFDYLRGRPRPFVLPDPLILELRRALPAASRVLTDQPMEVTLATGALVPHKPIDAISYILSNNPGPEYVDALFSLSPRAMAAMKISHLVMSDWWYAQLPPPLRARLENRDWFRLTYSTESQVDSFGGRWHRVYTVRAAYFGQEEAMPTLAELAALIPRNATVYISPGIPYDLRWPFEYALRSRQLFAEMPQYNHTTATIQRRPIQFAQDYDVAILNTQSDADRWHFWAFARQDTPFAWSASGPEIIWQNYGVAAIALPLATHPDTKRAGSTMLMPVTVDQPLQTTLRPAGPFADQPHSLRVRIFTPQPATIGLTYGDHSTELNLAPGLSTIFTPDVAPPLAVSVDLRQGASLSASVALIRAAPPSTHLQNPSIHLQPRFENEEFIVEVTYINPDRFDAGLLEPRWSVTRADLVHNKPWHASGSAASGEWQSNLALSSDNSQLQFSLNPATITASEATDAGTATLPSLGVVELSPRRAYVLYFNVHAPGFGRQTALPLAKFYLDGDNVSSVELFSHAVSLGF